MKIQTRKNTVTGIVVSDKMPRTVTIKTERRVFIKKYERYATRYQKIKAHNPEEIGAKEGDMVTAAECRPLSKTKQFIVIEKKEQ